MISVYCTDNQLVSKLEKIEPGSWVAITAPTEEDLCSVSQSLGIEIDLLRAATDEEERARLEVEEGKILILVDIPMVEAEDSGYVYSTIPLGIIMTAENIVTVCLKDTPLLRHFFDGRVTSFSTKKKSRFILQMLHRNATAFLSYLKQIDKASTSVEMQLHKSLKNKELIQMLRLEKSLVFFSTSLKANEIVMEKLLRMPFIKQYPDDTDLLEDVIIENKQAIEMCQIYMDILSGTMDAFASVISNNLNMVMKLLTSITIILAIPTLIASLWGMNVPVPLTDNGFGFWAILCLCGVLAIVCIVVMHRKNML